jgi:hypothetical protein
MTGHAFRPLFGWGGSALSAFSSPIDA